jgi:tetratricopeptide (TPR) repeat protein
MSHTPRRRSRRTGREGARAGALLIPLLVLACGGDSGGALERGDRLLGSGQTDAAVAEYRLAQRQGGEGPEIDLRLAHAHAEQGDVERSHRYYARLLASDSSFRYQAAADLVQAAREALERGGEERLARSLRPVLDLGLDLVPADLRAVVGIYYAERAEFEDALPILLSLAEEEEPPSAEVTFWTARAYEDLGACEQAVEHFRRYLDDEEADGSRTESARWHFGRCLFDVAEARWRDGDVETTLERLGTLTSLGVPRTILDRAYFLQGEALLARDRPQEALESFQQVLRLNPTRSGPLARDAEEMIRRIRYSYD